MLNNSLVFGNISFHVLFNQLIFIRFKRIGFKDTTKLKCNNLWQDLRLIQIRCIFTPKTTMARQSISLTKPNDEWLKSQVSNNEYSSKSELINDLIRQARKQQVEIDWIRAKLERAESSGFTDETKEEILAQSKALING